MIGGVVIEAVTRDDRVRLRVAERLYDEDGSRAGIGDECGVFISPEGTIPSVGDDVWWQSGKVYWTPADRRFVDFPLKKVGYSSSHAEALSDEGWVAT
jgi:hypothetical protein